MLLTTHFLRRARLHRISSIVNAMHLRGMRVMLERWPEESTDFFT